MEAALIKKILAFSGRMVHNREHPIRQDKRICCKTHIDAQRKTERTAKFEGNGTFLRGIKCPRAEYAGEPAP